MVAKLLLSSCLVTITTEGSYYLASQSAMLLLFRIVSNILIISVIRKKPRKHYSASLGSDDSRLSTSYLANVLEELKTQGHQSSTKKMYYGVWKNFNKFLIKLDWMPPEWEIRVGLFCAHLIRVRKLQSATIKTYVSAIKAVLAEDGYIWNKNRLLLNAVTRGCKMENDHVTDRRPHTIGFARNDHFPGRKIL